jgi:transposase-like protein
MRVNLKQRRRHSPPCTEPVASVAAVELAFELKDSLLRQWRRAVALRRLQARPPRGLPSTLNAQ